MKRLLKLNLLHLYLPISLGLLILSIFLGKEFKVQLEIAVIALMIYVSFSLAHHYLDKTLTFETTLEYILIAVLVLIILTGSIT